MVAIIDYDAGNIKSVEKAVIALGEETIVTRDHNVILAADHVILPGVGAFGDAMEKLHRYELVEIISRFLFHLLLSGCSKTPKSEKTIKQTRYSQNTSHEVNYCLEILNKTVVVWMRMALVGTYV